MVFCPGFSVVVGRGVSGPSLLSWRVRLVRVVSPVFVMG